MKNSTKLQVWSYWVGILIIVISHIFMLIQGLPEEQFVSHAILNLVAVLLIGFAWVNRGKVRL